MIGRLKLRLGALTCLIALATPHSLAAAQAAAPSETVTVIVSGTGRTEDEAMKQAFTNAVQSAAGLIVDAETLVKNDAIIKDQVLTASSAIITHYDRVGDPVPDGGLITVKIKAVVKKSDLVSRLAKARVISVPVSGNDLWAEARTRVQNAGDARKMLQERAPDILLSLLTARLVDNDGHEIERVERCDQKPDTKTASIWCAWNVQVSVDRKTYYAEVAPRLNNLFSTICQDKSGAKDRYSPAPNEPSEVSIVGEPIRVWDPLKVDGVSINGSDGKTIPLMLSISGDRPMSHQQFASFTLSEDYRKLLEHVFAPAALRVKLIRRDGSEIRSTLVPFDQNMRRQRDHWEDLSQHHNPIKGRTLKEVMGSDDRFGLFGAWWGPLWIAPEFTSRDAPLASTNSLLFRYETDLDPDDLKDLKELRFTFERAGS